MAGGAGIISLMGDRKVLMCKILIKIYPDRDPDVQIEICIAYASLIHRYHFSYDFNFHNHRHKSCRLDRLYPLLLIGRSPSSGTARNPPNPFPTSTLFRESPPQERLN